VEQLAQGHLNDTPIDNSEFPPEDLFPTDHLTRDAAVGFLSEAFRSLGYTPDTVVLGEGTYVTYNVYVEWPGTTKADEAEFLAGNTKFLTAAIALIAEVQP
jgi:hypothetical protein